MALQQRVQKAQVWDVVEVITSCLNLFVSTYVMNQSRGHWMLLDSLTITIALIVSMEAALLPLSGRPEIFDSFENEIFVLHRNMRLEVIKVIKPFLQFLRTFDGGQVHNMMAIMLDPHFKSFRIVENLLGCGNAIQLVTEYDVSIVIPLLMVCFEQLNPIAINALVVVVVDVVGEEFEENMFGVGASIEESSHALVTESYFCLRGFMFSIYMCRSTSMVVHP